MARKQTAQKQQAYSPRTSGPQSPANAAGILLSPQQIALLSIDEIRAKVVALGADYHPSEVKLDLAARLMQLQGIHQPTDKLKRELQQSGLVEDGGQPLATKRLTREEMTKALQPFIRKGLEFKVKRDGTEWYMLFRCTQRRQDGVTVPAIREDSGNTLMPLQNVVFCAMSLTTVKAANRASMPKTAFERADADDDATVAAADRAAAARAREEARAEFDPGLPLE